MRFVQPLKLYSACWDQIIPELPTVSWYSRNAKPSHRSYNSLKILEIWTANQLSAYPLREDFNHSPNVVYWKSRNRSEWTMVPFNSVRHGYQTRSRDNCRVSKGTRWVSLCTYVIQTDYICQNLKFDFNDLCCRKSLKSGVERQTQDNVQTGETNSDSHLQTPSSPTPPPPQKKKN